MFDEHIYFDGRRYRLSRWSDGASPPLDGRWEVRSLLAEPTCGAMVRHALDRMGHEVDERSDAELCERLVQQLESRQLFLFDETPRESFIIATGPVSEEAAIEEGHHEAAVAKSWIEIELVGEDDLPIPNQRYELRLPDESLRRGTTDHRGLARLTGIDPGACELTFPDLDQSAWGRG